MVGLPQVKWFGKDDEHYYMVINLLGESLQTIKNSRGVFSLTFTLQVGIQIIQLLKSIHDCGLIHRDIKPDNFLLGLGDKAKQLHIIDFGFCKPFLKECNPLKKTNGLIGSLMYASVCAHKCCEQSRRDDLESLGYMLLYFLKGSLEWQHCVSSAEVLQMKESINSGVVLSEYFKIVKQLSFEERPDYNKLIELFSKRIEEEQKKKGAN
jgi:serine/threonine protein kinase